MIRNILFIAVIGILIYVVITLRKQVKQNTADISLLKNPNPLNTAPPTQVNLGLPTQQSVSDYLNQYMP